MVDLAIRCWFNRCNCVRVSTQYDWYDNVAVEIVMKVIDEILLFIIQLLHWIFLVLIGVAIPLVLLLEPFYISLPICAWIMHLGFSRTLDCPWTRLENYYRSRTGREEIGGFISHNLKLLGLKKK
jgi:hypothetical protein